MKPSSVISLEGILNINNLTILSVYKDLKPEHYYSQLEGSYFAPISWQAGHITNNRFQIAEVLGIDLSTIEREMKTPELYNKAYDTSLKYDGIEIKNDWDTITEKINGRLAIITEIEFTATIETKLPTQDKSPRGIMSFMMWHESYHLGQMGGLRKYFGYLDVQHTFYDVIKELQTEKK